MATRDIYLFETLEDDVARKIIKKMRKLDREDPHSPIDLYINSMGGSAFDADSIIATMFQLSCKVNTIGLGSCQSGAADILTAGTGERSAYEFCVLMYHEPTDSIEGKASDVRVKSAHLAALRNNEVELLTRCTGQKRRAVKGYLERDFYISAFQAKELGFIDAVIPAVREK